MHAHHPALIIIDMQQGMASPAAGSRNNPGAEHQIATLLLAWRAADATVVHVRHISRTPGSPFWPGQPGVEFQAALAPLPEEHVVEKNVPDAFIHSGLERWLRVRSISKLVIVGVSTNNSVESSARTKWCCISAAAIRTGNFRSGASSRIMNSFLIVSKRVLSSKMMTGSSICRSCFEYLR